MIVENFIGRVYESDNFGKFRIIDKGIGDNNLIIRFLDTGFITEANYSTIRHGKVKDLMVPNVADIGYIGSNINVTDKKYFIYYNSWNDMINRCYNIFDEMYYAYGEIGVKVYKSWHNFTTFYHDCQLLPNYLKKEKYPNRYQLDKDYLQFNVPKEERIYSKYTCIWISDTDNTILRNLEYNKEHKKYYGVEYRNNAYCTRIRNKIYGSFLIPEAAAYLYNILYPKYVPNDEFHDIVILNHVRSFTYEELLACVKPGAVQNWFNDYPR